ncbi:pyridoxal phosphate-dependent aminotransferase [Shouchella clausii]|uniref:pyridoxal phosphate-dependent aminotransferase n=1 Tax=Shouchella clausii TaxID=79880 RepID=UPI00266CFF9D|nr:pyridoxal phosphate-dependent aminotransferase [Shouchella clausii]
MAMDIQQAKMMEQLPSQFFAKLVNKAQRLAQEHNDLINLGQGNHDQPTPAFIVEALREASSEPQFHRYGPFRGYSFLKEAIAAYYKQQYGVELDPETEVAIVPGTKTAIVELCQCLLNKGDMALVPDPGYPDYLSGIAITGAIAKPMPLLRNNRFLPDYHELGSDVLDKAKMMFLNYPNNPTGATADARFFDDTVAVARSHCIAVIHDFAYGAIGFNGTPCSFLQQEGAKDVGVELFTMSKLYNMAGWRVGFVLGNKEIVAMLEELQDHYHCSLFGGLQAASACALQSDQSSVHELVGLYKERSEALWEAAQEIGWQVEQPSGSFFAWLPVPKGYTSEEFSELLLDKAHLVVAPGNGFGQYGEGYVRIGLLADKTTLREAIARVGNLNLF